MNDITKFVNQWAGRGYEKGETQTFWLSFLRDVLGVSEPEKFIQFEVPVKLKHTNFIDCFLPDTKVIIEQKSLAEHLTQKKSQSDGSTLTPYEQAQRYSSGLPYSMRPRWIIACNFAEFLIYDMETLGNPQKISLHELPQKFHAFDFMVDAAKTKIRIELELSLKAGEIVGKLYDALKAQYVNPDSDESLQSLNKLCVRLVFCLYAESTGIFGGHKIFRDYLQGSRNIRRDLLDLFEVLDTPKHLRSPYLPDELKNFPYVNGGLFTRDEIEIPNFTPAIKDLLLDEASSSFNWSGISPTIFGAVFESTLNPTTRRAGGMHYTSVENIHKVIDPLFLDDLKAEFNAAKKSARNKKKLSALQDKIASLKILDPACGSGNFLTESYLSLRRLENDILKELLGDQIQLGVIHNPIKVSIAQFYGIEINDFAVAVAQTALWIAELQMLQQTQSIIHQSLDFLPIKSYANITEANALRLDWHNLAPNDLNFIIGNPPFVGYTFQTPTQKADIANIFSGVKSCGKLDYVACWFKKAADFIRGRNIFCAFVATNSITQGEQVAILWKNLDVHINFACKTFKWISESKHMAQVHVVIIGFSSAQIAKPKIIFDGDKKISATNINGYLVDAPNVFIENRSKPICNVPEMTTGNRPADGGNLIIEADDYEDFIQREPAATKYIKRLIGAEEFINGKKRYCLWLVVVSPAEIKKLPLVFERVKACREDRLKGAPDRQKLANTPALFRETKNPPSAVVVPKTSSENRFYLPIDFVDAEIILTDALFIIPNAGLYEFGVLTSSVHMAWLRAVGGRLKSDYRYSKNIVYNNFVWCSPTEQQKISIELTAQKILDARAGYGEASLAELYDEVLMPPDLRKAHQANDRAVMAAYGFSAKLTEAEIVAELMKQLVMRN